MEFNIDKFNSVKDNAEAFYKSLREVYCPYFKEKISFNSQGLEHLKYKRRNWLRGQKDQFMRFKMLHFAPEIISASNTLQGILKTKNFEKIRVNSRTDNKLSNVTYFEFIAVMDNNRIKVIVKQIENNEKVFWSIIPFWGMNKNRIERVLHEGIPEDD
ncbi:MAG: hypothetical protein WCP15_03755 [bacterium]